MINYVNNAFDRVLKPCDAQRFYELTRSEQTEKLILGHRVGEKNSKSKLPALTYMGVLDTDKYRKYLDRCKEQGTKPQGSRKAEFMRPTGLLMLDFDHVGNPNLATQRPPSNPSKGGGLAPTPSTAMTELLRGGWEGGGPIELWEYIKSRYAILTKDKSSPFGGTEGGFPFALAHITPSGDGLRLVVARDKGKSIAECQYRWTHEVLPWLGVDIKCDGVCKDISRLSFAPMQSEILHFNPSLLFAELPEASDYPDGSIFGASPVILSNAKDLAECSGENVLQGPSAGSFASAQDDTKGESQPPKGGWGEAYNGVPYSDIVARLEEQLGGRPEHGARNSFIFTMACNLRYICNDNADWVASVLPTYGEEPQKHRMTIQSAINRPMSRAMPETLKRALGVAKLCADADPNCQLSTVNCQLPPALPTALPEPIALLTSRTPDKMKPAVAMSVFPPLGAHIKDLRVTYWDGREYEPTFMNIVVAELSSGKSAVNTPIEYVMADIEARDDVSREKEQQWKNSCASISSTQDKPSRPKGLAVQSLSADMTNASFVQRLADAEGHFLYTQMDEIELLDALRTNGRAGSVSAVLRLAFDCGKYGQERVAANAVNAKVRVRWNWNASSTIQRVRKYFAGSIADGTLSRISFATIIKEGRDYGRNRPRYLPYGEHFADELRSYIDRLCTCQGTLHCPEAEVWAERLCDEMADFAEEMEDEAYATMSFRAVLMGFFRAMLLYVMNGMRWTDEIAEFAAWSVRYDLWCKMRYFGDMLHKDLEGEQNSKQRGPVSLLTLLPAEFTSDDVKSLRVSLGMQADPRQMLANWLHRKCVVRDEIRDVFIKQ